MVRSVLQGRGSEQERSWRAAMLHRTWPRLRHALQLRGHQGQARWVEPGNSPVPSDTPAW